MSECPERVTYGEFDHSEVATSAVFDANDQQLHANPHQFDTASVCSDMSHVTTATQARYDDYAHMMHMPPMMMQQQQHQLRPRQQQQQQPRRLKAFNIGDRVLHYGEECEVYRVAKDHIVLENNHRQYTIFRNDFHLLQHIM